MNSVVVFLPRQVSSEEMDQVVKGASTWVSWSSGGGDTGSGRVYWHPAPDIRREYEAELWAEMDHLGADPSFGWLFDYSMGLVAIRSVLGELARQWPSCVIDLDVGSPITGTGYSERVEECPEWDWWAE